MSLLSTTAIISSLLLKTTFLDQLLTVHRAQLNQVVLNKLLCNNKCTITIINNIARVIQ
jgi:hypothetical protein